MTRPQKVQGKGLFPALMRLAFVYAVLGASAARAGPSIEVIHVDETAATSNGWTNVGAANFAGTTSGPGNDSNNDRSSSDGDATYATSSTNGDRLIMSIAEPRYIKPNAVINRVRTVTNMKNSAASKNINFLHTLDGITFSTFLTKTVSTSYFDSLGPWWTTRPGGGAFSVADVSNFKAVFDTNGTTPAEWRITKAFAEVEYVNETPVDCTLTYPTEGLPAIDPFLTCGDINYSTLSYNDQSTQAGRFVANLVGSPTFSSLSINYTYLTTAAASNDTVTVEYSWDPVGFTSPVTIEGPSIIGLGTFERRVDLAPANCPGGTCDEADLSNLMVRVSTQKNGSADTGFVRVDCLGVAVTPTSSTCDPSGAGRAATYTVAEIRPNLATAGATGVEFSYLVKPTISATLGDTGVDVVTLTLGAGWTNPALVRVEQPLSTVLTAGVNYTDTSGSTPATDDLQITLLGANKLTTTQTGLLVFTADAPAASDSGVRFTCTVDDSATGAVAPQPCLEGDVAGISNYESDANSQYVLTAAAATSNKLAFTTSERVFTAGSCGGAGGVINVQLRDAANNPLAAPVGGQSFTAVSDSAGTVAWYTDPSCATPAPGGVFTILAGQNSVDLYYTDTKAGSPQLALTNGASLENPPPQVHTVVAAGAYQLAIPSPGRTFTAGQCGGAARVITVELQDLYGNPVNAGVGGQAFTASSNSLGTVGWFTDSSCLSSAGAGSFTIASGQYFTEVYYTDTKAGTPTVTLSSALVDPAQQQTVVAGAASVLVKAGGDGQTAEVGTVLPGAILARVEDVYGNPVQGVLVSFSASGGASIAPGGVLSAANGEASAVGTLSTVAGPNSFTVTSGVLPALSFSATGTAAAASTLVKVGGDAQTAEVNTALPLAFLVRVEDAYGNPVQGVTVNFSASGGASVAPGSVPSAANGEASAVGTLSTAAGPNNFTVTSGVLPALSFSATGTAAAASTLVKVGGDAQTAEVGTALPLALVARVEDTYGNPVQGVTVSFSASGNASTTPGSAPSLGNGQASVAATLGTVVGPYSFIASAGALPSVTFNATATVGAAAALVKVSGDAQTAEVNTALPLAFLVRVEDAYGNPVEGATVNFSASGGASVAPGSMPSAANGEASAVGTLSTAAGTNNFTVSFGALPALSFTATGTAAAAAALVKVSGDAQTAEVNTALPLAFVVQVEDAYGNPVQGVTVNFAASGGASVTPISALSGGTGDASAVGTLSTAAGANNFTVTAGALPSLSFTATGTAGAAAVLVKVSGDGQTAEVGTALPVALVARVEDSYGNPVQGVTVSFSASGGASVTPTAVPTAANGEASAVATLGTLSGGTTFQATAGGLPAVTFSATATASAPAQLAFLTPQRTFIAGACATAAEVIVVELKDAFGNPVTAGGAGENFTATTDSTGTIGWYSGEGCVSPAVGGAFTIPAGQSAVELYYFDTQAGAPSISLANLAGLTNPLPQVHTVVAGDPWRLAFGVQPGRTVLGQPLVPAPEVAFEDSFGNPVASSASVTVALGNNPGGGTLGGTLTANAVGGLAAFPGLSIDAVGNGYTLVASSAGVIDATSASFDVVFPLALTPASTLSPPRGSVAFVASGGMPPYVFTLPVNGSGGSVNSSSGSYLAGAIPNSTDQVLVTDSAGATASGQVNVGPGVSITPSSPSVAPSGLLGFSASGGSGSGYAWQLTAAPSGGSIDLGTGAYQAGPVAGTTDLVQVIDSLGNVATTSVLVGAPLVLVPGSTTLSSGQSLNFSAQGGAGGYSFSFAPGGNLSNGSITAQGLYVAGPVGNTVDVVQVTDSASATATGTVSIANNPPVVVLSYPAQVVAGMLVEIDASLSLDPDGDSLGFTFGQTAGPATALTTAGAKAQLLVPTATAGTTLSYLVQAIDGRGGQASATANLLIRGLGGAPLITSVPSTAGSQGVPYAYDLDLTPSATGDAPIRWSGSLSPADPSFFVSSANGRIYWLPQSPGSYQLELVAQNLSGSDRQRFVVEVGGATAPSFIQSATLTALVGAPYAYDSDFRVEATGSQPMQYSVAQGPQGFFVDPSTGWVKWVPAAPGSFDVLLNAHNREGSDSYAFTIQVVDQPPSPPVAVADATPGSGPAPLPVTFSGARSTSAPGTPLISYRWEFGDGTPPVYLMEPPLKAFGVPGGYLARLEVTDVLGQKADAQAPVLVTQEELSPPVARIIASQQAGEESLTIAFSCDCTQGSSPIVGFLWEYGDSDSSVQTSPTHTYGEAGGYRVHLTVIDQNGLVGQDVKSISVTLRGMSPPFVRAYMDPPRGPAPLRVQFSAEYGDYDGLVTALSWTIDQAPATFSGAIQHTFGEPGLHTVCLEAVDNDGLRAIDCLSVNVESAAGLSPPEILSRPNLVAYVGVPWYYDEDGTAVARGSRPLTWTIGTTVGEQVIGRPEGMSIQPLTGKLSWTPTKVGVEPVILVARNAAAFDVDTFRVTVQPPGGPPASPPVNGGCGGCQGAPGSLAFVAFFSLLLARRKRRLPL